MDRGQRCKTRGTGKKIGGKIAEGKKRKWGGRKAPKQGRKRTHSPLKKEMGRGGGREDLIIPPRTFPK